MLHHQRIEADVRLEPDRTGHAFGLELPNFSAGLLKGQFGLWDGVLWHRISLWFGPRTGIRGPLRASGGVQHGLELPAPRGLKLKQFLERVFGIAGENLRGLPESVTIRVGHEARG